MEPRFSGKEGPGTSNSGSGPALLGSSPSFLTPEGINFLVVGGETNPIFHTTDYVHYKTASVDRWVPASGIKLDKKPLRMPAYKACEDELCIIGQQSAPAID